LEIRARGGGEVAHLRFGQLGGVVARVPLGGQPLALDRIGEDDARPGAVDSLERRDELAEDVASEFADEGGQRTGSEIVYYGPQPGGLCFGRAGEQTLVYPARLGADQPVVRRVGRLHEPVLQRLPARGGKGGFESAGPGGSEDLPVSGFDQGMQTI